VQVGAIAGHATGAAVLPTLAEKVSAETAAAPPAKPAKAMAATANRFVLRLIPMTVPSRREAGVA
jgi:hypothetical protein